MSDIFKSYLIINNIFRSTNDELIFESHEKSTKLHLDLVKSRAETMVDVLKYTVSKYGNKPIMGTREIIAELGNKIISSKYICGFYETRKCREF